jgi:hypothetical protein
MLGTERRTRTLGLGAAVRAFNDLAVPGLGGAWFGKQLFLATLGVAIAQRVRDSGRRVQNIEVADAVEALACWLALTENGWHRDPRLRGATKMRDKSNLSFASVRRPGFYVTQPMRQATVQPLRALGLVESAGERFNGFICTKLGHEFVDATCTNFAPYNRSVLDHLVLWARGLHDSVSHSWPLTQALTPLVSLSKPAAEFLRERICQGSTPEASRRRNALNWVERLRAKPKATTTWNAKPSTLDDLHWRDLHAGALFFAARDEAIFLLDEIEVIVANQVEQRLSLDAPLPRVVVEKATVVRASAQAFLDNQYDPSPALSASTFCRACTEDEDTRLIEQLLTRDGRVLRQRGRDIVPGVAFRGSQTGETESGRSPEESGAEAEIDRTIPLPNGISRRMHNLFLLNIDLRDELNEWMGISPEEHGGN